MSGNVRLRWVNPTQRTDNTPATLADIAEIRIDVRQQAIPTFTLVATLTTPTEIQAATRLFPNVSGGTWVYRVHGIDKQGQPFDSMAEVTILVPTAALKGVTGLTATIE